MSSVINLKSVGKYQKNFQSNASEYQVPSLSSSMDNIKMPVPNEVNPQQPASIVKTLDSCNMKSGESSSDDMVVNDDFIVNQPDGDGFNIPKKKEKVMHNGFQERSKA